MSTTWRDQARPIIASAIEEGRRRGLEGRNLRRFVNDQWTWGPRAYHPWRIWSRELTAQLAGKPGKPRNHRRIEPLPGQTALF